MPFITSWENNSFYADFSGEVTAAEIDTVNEVFTGDIRFETVRYSLWDMSRISKLTVPDSSVEFAAANDIGASRTRPALRGAMVVPESGHVRELAERYLAIMNQLDSTWDTRLFTDVMAAKMWLSA